jgi:putative Ca2+/H+ antiporter (TMEM165/GDT1 family)
MEDILGNLNPIYTLIFSFILTTISKISDNSFITLVLMKKKSSSTILYISSIFSSLILNLLSIILGYIISYFMKIDIIKNYFLILIFTIYGLMSIILVCRVFSKEGLRKNKLIEQILNDSSEEESERPRLPLKTDRSEMEIELDNFNTDGSMENKANLDKSSSHIGINNDTKCNIGDFIRTLNSLISIEIGEKIQIFNMALASKYKNWIFLILGNIIGVLIVNGISILYGLEVLQKKINYIFMALEGVIYLSVALYYIYLCI